MKGRGPGSLEKGETTGLHIRSGEHLRVLRDDRKIVYVEYDDLSHSFWRSQEFTLFDRHRDAVQHPLLDLGCGDGSFGSTVFDKIEFGVDPDTKALDVARSSEVYQRLVCSGMEEAGIEAQSIGTVFSNSVLEHTVDLDAVLSEVSRILRPGGKLIFTVPNDRFTKVIAEYFGRTEADRLNKTEFIHRNLLSNEEWRQRLERASLRPAVLHNYQPDDFTVAFRLMRSPFMILSGLNSLVWPESRRLAMIADSVRCGLGAGTFVIAEKRGGDI